MPVRKLSRAEREARDARFREVMFHGARHWGELSRSRYEQRVGLPSQADPVDGFLYDLMAKAFRRFGQGDDLNTVLDEIKSEWLDFCREQKAKVDAAPKLRRGPMSGCSVIHGAWADPGRIESTLIFLRGQYNWHSANA